MRKYIVIWLTIAILTNMLLSLATISAKPAGWSEDINLSYDDDKYSGYPSIDIFKDRVHVVWMDQRHYPVTNRPEVYYKNSSDGGRTWNPEVRLTFSDSTKTFPRIAVNGNKIHIVWVDDRDGGWKLYYINSTDGGDTWSTDRMISSFASSDNPAIAVNDNNIHVVYISNFKLYYLNSTNNGITWSVPQQLTTSNRDSNHPAISLNGNNVDIVWMDHYDKNGQGTLGAIFYMNSSDSGLTWSEDFNLTPMNLDADYPDIATNGNIIHIAFSEEVSGIWETHYRRSEDSGISWSEDIQLTDLNRDHQGSSIDAYKANVSIVWWSNWLVEPDGNGEIYYINSTDNGYSWSENLRLTYAAGYSGSADISMSDHAIHVLWADKRDGNVEIYYKHYPVFADLSISSDSVIFSDIIPNIGMTTQINATIQNIGEENVTATIEFYDGDPSQGGVFINSTDVTVNITESINATINWIPSTNGTRYIYVQITNVSSFETNISNNIANKSVIVNREPELTNIPSIYSLSEDSIENQLINLSDYAKDDLDSWDELSFDIVTYSNSSIVSVSVFDGHFLSVDTLTGSANDNWTGTIEIVIEVTDTLGLTNVSNEFTVTVTSVNDAPIVLNPIPNFSIEEDTSDSTTLNLTNVFFDSDNSSLHYTYSGSTNISVIIHDNGSVTFTPLENWTGDETITFYATDNLTSPVSDTITIALTPINDAPVVIETISDFDIDEDTLDDSTVDLADVFYDVDNATLYYSYSGSNNISVIVHGNGSVTFIPAENWSGIETITFSATDNLTAPISEDVTITVTPINDPPVVINLISDFNMFEDTTNSTAVNLNDVFYDVDNTTLYYYHSGNGNINVIIDQDGSVTFSPLENWTGIETITFYATDDLTDPISEDVTITVIPINDPPVVINPISDFNMFEDTINSTAVDLDHVFFDCDNTSLYYYSEHTNINVIIHDDGTVTLIPLENWTGSETITFYATDNLSHPISEDVTITVIGINDPPIITVLSPSNNSNYFTPDTIYFNVTVFDIDSNTFTYLWDFGDGTTSTTKNATHQFSEAGIYNVSITVSDGSASDMRIVTIVVEPVTIDGDENGFDILSFLLILMAIIIVVILLLFLVWRRRIKAEKDDEQG